MEKNPKKKRNVILISATAIVLVAAGVFFWNYTIAYCAACDLMATAPNSNRAGMQKLTSSLGGGNNCATDNSGAEFLEATFDANLDSLLDATHNVAFPMTDWCDRELSDPKLCRCRWNVDSMMITSDESLPWGDTIQGLWTLPTAQGWTAVPFTCVLQPVIPIPSAWMLPVYEGTNVSFYLPGIDNPSGVHLSFGNLCIVENIDGGDYGEQWRICPRTQPLFSLR